MQGRHAAAERRHAGRRHAPPSLPSSHATCAPPAHLCAVAYIAGICLLVGVATCLIVAAFVLRRKDRQHMRALAAAREQQAAAEAEAEAAAAAYRAANPLIIPVVIVQPDGEVTLAEKCGKGWGAGPADLEEGGGGGGGGELKGGIKSQPQQPPGSPGSHAQQ